MQEIKLSIPAPNQDYTVAVGHGLLTDAARILGTADYSQVLIVTDQNMAKLWLHKLEPALPGAHTIVVDPGEHAKSLGTVEQIWTALAAGGADRHSLVVILGGGVVGDLAGFAASTYERGVAFAQIPTTIVAQADSSIGGKTGFDFAGLKNLIGTFAQPKTVLVDTDLLGTLPPRQLRAGFAEMLKHGLIADAGYFERLCAKHPTDFTASELADLVAASIRIKAAIVTSDITESGKRKLVNFGHTVGHAVEALSWDTPHPLLHGEAVAIGMVAETALAHEKGYLSDKDIEQVRKCLSAAGLPITIPGLNTTAIMEKMHRDKKDNHGVIEYTLLKQIGKADYDQTIDDAVAARIIALNTGPIHAK